MGESCRSTEFLESDVVADMHQNFLTDEQSKQTVAVYPDTCVYGRLRNSIVDEARFLRQPD